MGKRYNTRIIKADYSYYVEQIADLLSVDVGTVRRWMRKEGLKRILHTRPHLIHSSELRAFLERMKARRKKPCAVNEMFCLPCQSPRVPKPDSLTATPLTNGRIRLVAVCGTCDRIMNRTIRAPEWGQNHPFARFMCDALGEHSGVQPPHRECPLQQEEE